MCWEEDSVLSSHTPMHLYEVTTSSSKPSRGSNRTCGERGIILTKPPDLCFGGVQNKVKGRESLLDTKKVPVCLWLSAIHPLTTVH
jgi:hypothetical protein